jgi:hypothetical protein
VADVATASFGSVATSQPCHYRAIRSGPDRAPADNYGQRQCSLDLRHFPPSQITTPPELALQAGGRGCMGVARPG